MADWPRRSALFQASAEIKVDQMRNPALDAWGDYDRDDPYPLFAQVRAEGPVHEVTLADGHRAWLIAGHQEAKAASTAPACQGHARRTRPRRGGGRRRPAGPAFARHMLSVNPPDHPGCAG